MVGSWACRYTMHGEGSEMAFMVQRRFSCYFDLRMKEAHLIRPTIEHRRGVSLTAPYYLPSWPRRSCKLMKMYDCFPYATALLDFLKPARRNVTNCWYDRASFTLVHYDCDAISCADTICRNPSFTQLILFVLLSLRARSPWLSFDTRK
jgi:hypothetical protein